MAMTATTMTLPKSPNTPKLAAPPTQESIVSRFIVAPVLFASFLISLFVVDRSVYTSVFSGPKDSTPELRPASPSSSDQKDDYYSSNKRKLARREMEDAFQLRGKVIAGMVICMSIAVAFIGWCGSKIIQAMKSK